MAAGSVDDARPDRWGERVIRLMDRPPRLSTLDHLYYAGDDRFGALGVSSSSTDYQPRRHGPLPTLPDLQALSDLVRRVERGESVSDAERRLVTPGTTLGGARPKALLDLDGQTWVVKFAEQGDVVDAPLIEHATMTLAARAGIQVCETRALPLGTGPSARHAVVIRRFDREGPRRVHALSAHVALRAAGQEFGYPELALLLRRRASADTFRAEGEQLFRRMAFNILVDNTDDHEKNHVLLVDADQRYRLSPAFDVLPAMQSLGYQQMRVGRSGSESTCENAGSECRAFGLTPAQAREVWGQVARVVEGWRAHFAGAGVSEADVEELARSVDRDALRAQRRDGNMETGAL